MSQHKWMGFLVVSVLAAALGLAGCKGSDGSDGSAGRDGRDGRDGQNAGDQFDLATLSNEEIADLDVVSEVTNVQIASPPVVTFTVKTTSGVPIVGIGEYWEDSNRFVRFTLAKLVPGAGLGDPNSWVAYTRDTVNDGTTPPDYDTGTLVDNGDGSYTFTFNTDVNAVTGVPYEPNLTHRLAGQIGSGAVPLARQNLVHDFVPSGAEITETRAISMTSSCNECHDGIVFHGSRFKVEYCVNCHNPDLAQGEGEFGYMIHKIHAAQAFNVLDDAIDYSEVTYPQDLRNCRKCHNGDDVATPDGDNWRRKPSQEACASCHEISFVNPPPAGLTLHSGGDLEDNSVCSFCHPARGGLSGIEDAHYTLNATPNNPLLPVGVPVMAFDISAVTVDANGFPTVTFRVTADGVPLDVTALPDRFVDEADGDAFRWPSFLMGWAEPQGDIMTPSEYNNLGENEAEPRDVSLGALVAAGAVDCSSGTECVADFSVLAGPAFPMGATLRAIGLQGYFQYDTDDNESADVSLHTPSVVRAVTGDEARRTVVDNNKCSSCHEWFEGHGGNRTLNMEICMFCHNPNRSSSSREVDPAGVPAATLAALGPDPLTYPERTQNMKDMIHGIHASAFRTTDFEHVRNRNGGLYYNWSEVTFPAENGVRNCSLCHVDGTAELPVPANSLPTTEFTTTGDPAEMRADVIAARASVPNNTDLVNSPASSACYMCHDSTAAVAHMELNGGAIERARSTVMGGSESCTVCHGEGRFADVAEAHAGD